MYVCTFWFMCPVINLKIIFKFNFLFQARQQTPYFTGKINLSMIRYRTGRKCQKIEKNKLPINEVFIYESDTGHVS